MSGPAAALSLDTLAAAHPAAAGLDAIRRDLVRLRSQSGPEARRERRALLGVRNQLEEGAREAVLARSELIATTFGSLARWADKLPPARTAVVDEATQATEPSVWIAIPRVERLVLVGDPEQLGPVVKEPGNPLADSLLQRLVASGADAPMLTEQHRMSAPIAALVADVYGPAYHPSPDVADHRLADLPDVTRVEATTTPVTFVDTAGWSEGERRDEVTRSLFHPGEVALVARVVAEWRAAGVADDAIGVITPYSAQVARLRSRLAGIEVATVNAFQGREKEAVVVSLVRSNPDGELGFVADRRRLVVALTRARRALVLVGDGATLAHAPIFADLLGRIDAVGGLQSAWSERWSSQP
jgi:superfamily I DNA and/or RNA helicase